MASTDALGTYPLQDDLSLEEVTFVRTDCDELLGITQLSDDGEVMDVFLTRGQAEQLLPILTTWLTGNDTETNSTGRAYPRPESGGHPSVPIAASDT